MLSVCCVRGAVHGSGRYCTSLPQEHYSSCQSLNINTFPIPKVPFSYSKAPLGQWGRSDCWLHVPSLWEGEPNVGRREQGTSIFGCCFCCQAVFAFHTEKSMSCKGKHSKTTNSYNTWTLKVKRRQGVGVSGHA